MGLVSPDVKMSKRHIAQIALAGVVVLAVILVVLTLCVGAISRDLKTSLDEYMSEISTSTTRNVDDAIEKNFSVLHGAASFITLDNIDDNETLMRHFEEMVAAGTFDRVGLCYDDGSGFGYDSQLGELPVQSYAQESYFVDSMKGEDVVVAPRVGRWGDGEYGVFSVPVYNYGDASTEPIGVLLGITESDRFSRILDADLFGGKASLYLLDSNADIISSSKSLDVDSDGDGDFFARNYQESSGLETMRENLVDGIAGQAMFSGEGNESVYISYEPLDMNNWSVVLAVPSSYLDERNAAIFFVALILAVFTIVVAILFMFVIFHLYKRGERRLLQAASTDELTGIGNAYALTRTLQNGSFYFDGNWVLVECNVKGFSYFNRVFGYERGNELITSLASALTENIDADKDEVIVRLSGERFGLLLCEACDSDLAVRLDEIMEEIHRDLVPDNLRYQIVLQCAARRLMPEDAAGDKRLIIQSVNELLRRLAHVSENAKVFFSQDIMSEGYRRSHIESVMETALRNKEFQVYFQPQCDIGGEELVLSGAESLVRWDSPILGLLSPDEFISLFEENGFISKLDRYMLENTCVCLRKWLDEGITCVPVSVNVSSASLYQHDIVEEIAKVVDSCGVPRNLIKIEITESVMSESLQLFNEVSSALKEKGFAVIMDDFGSGYSSFSLLKDISFDGVKLDRAFFGGSLPTKKGRVIVSSVVDLLNGLGFEVLAEGVEDVREVEYLRSCGCRFIQGYYFGKPKPAIDFEHDFLRPAMERDPLPSGASTGIS